MNVKSLICLSLLLPCTPLCGDEPVTSANGAATVLSMKSLETTALTNHPSIQLAREETDIANLKRIEAKRALFPGLTAKGEETHGDAVDPLGTPAFTERSFGLEATHTLYAGGKLHNTYYQTVATWLSFVAKQKKAESDVLYGVREAAWNLIKAQQIAAVYDRAAKDEDRERAMAEQLIGRDAITRETYLQIVSQYNQAEAAADSAKADVEARLWQWTAALGLQAPPAYRPDAGSVQAPLSSATLRLDDCLRLAELNNPELTIQSKTAEAAAYASKAGAGLYKPTVTLNGFYGRSGGAFNSEDLHLREDWQATVQVSQYFALSSLNLSAFDQHTSPQIGQTTRTASKTLSGNVGILDGYKKKADAEDAAFSAHQADVQRQRTEMDVANGVRDAYANWKRAIARTKMAENDYPLMRTGYAIAKIKSAHREVPLSERAVWRNRQAQAEAAVEEAHANYQIAVAALAHAIGLPDRFYH